jgi:hypothetical protein
VTNVEARELLDAGPDGYTSARDAEVRRRRAERDREGAAALKALGKPSLALWAVLAAARDPRLPKEVVTATSALADTQGSAVRGEGAEQIAAAATARRRALDAIVDAAVGALGAHGKAVTVGHRAEISGIIDRVSRHPELLDDWVDGTLRDIPTDVGFDAFASMTPEPRSPGDRAPKKRAPASTASTPRSTTSTEQPSAAVLRQRAKADEARAKALASVSQAEHDMARAERAVRDARGALTAAEKARDAAKRTLETARRALAKTKS